MRDSAIESGKTSEPSDGALAMLREMFSSFGNAEQRAAQYILEHADAAMEMNVASLAKASGCSESTVVRMCQHAGYRGYHQLRLLVARELGDSSPSLETDGETNGIDRAIRLNTLRISMLGSEHNKQAITDAAHLLRDARKVLVCAVGNTAPIALDMSFRLNRFSIESYASPVFENMINYISNADERDVFVGISKSGASNMVYEATKFARKMGLKVMSITGDQDSRLARASDVVLLSSEVRDDLMKVQKGLQSHTCDLCLVDAVMYCLSDLIGKSDHDASDTAEFELAGWKE